MKKGYTLVEILFVMALIGILAAILIPNFTSSSIRAREAVLKENLFQIRDALGKFFFDTKKYPTSIEELLPKYLKVIPIDPIMNKREWQVVYYEPDEMEDFNPDLAEAIVDFKSLSEATSLDGSKYNEW
jgi:general secretion pathway protein G